MTADDFRAWRDRMGYNRTEAADALGIGRNTPQRYEEGEADVPLPIEFACRDLEQKRAVPADHVEVFTAYVYDGVKDLSIKTPSMRTRAAVAEIRGTIIEQSRRIVRKDQLDQFGRYFAPAGDASAGFYIINDFVTLDRLRTAPMQSYEDILRKELADAKLELVHLDRTAQTRGILTVHWRDPRGGPSAQGTITGLR